MSPVVALLDRPQASADEAWNLQVEQSLRADPDAWLAAADQGDLNKDRWWWLLSWVERMASAIAATRRADLVELAAFALALLEDGPVDPREAWPVGALVRRGAKHAGLDFGHLVRAGCARAGVRGAQCLSWLSGVSDRLSGSHREVGAGADFRFERIPQEPIDEEAFIRWLKGEG